MSMSWVRRMLGIDTKGRPPLPNTRKQLFIGGLVCIAIHPGILLIAMNTEAGRVDKGQEIFLIINPWLVVTLVGVWLLLLAVFSTQGRLNYKRTGKRKTHKERR